MPVPVIVILVIIVAIYAYSFYDQFFVADNSVVERQYENLRVLAKSISDGKWLTIRRFNLDSDSSKKDEPKSRLNAAVEFANDLYLTNKGLYQDVIVYDDYDLMGYEFEKTFWRNGRFCD